MTLIRRPFSSTHALMIALFAASSPILYASLSFERAWPLAFVALVPWALFVLKASPRVAIVGALLSVMPAYIAMHREIVRIAPLFHGVSWPAFAAALCGAAIALRFAARASRLPVSLLLPVCWAAGELVRASELVPPWHRIATALYRQRWALQVCDLGGMSAVSFALASSSGAVVGIALRRFGPEARRVHCSTRAELGIALALWSFVAVYGEHRLRESREAQRDGPAVLIVQTDEFIDALRVRSARERVVSLATLTRDALRRSERPALIVWPEAVLDAVISRPFLDAPSDAVDALPRALRSGDATLDRATLAREQAAGRARAQWIRALSAEFAAPVLVGGPALLRGADGSWRRYNAAHLVDASRPDADESHLKTRPFPLYERVPFDDARSGPLRWAHAQLASLRPTDRGWPAPVSAGAGVRRMPLGSLSFAATICFETEFADLAWTDGMSGASFWVNIADDSWGARQDDTLRAFRFNVFRSIESRVSIARSANAGVAAITGPTGEIFAAVGGATATRMPMPGRPELVAIERVHALRARIEQRARDSVAPQDAAGGTSSALPLLSEELRAAQRSARELSDAVRREGAIVARVRLDRRSTLYVRSRGLFDRMLVSTLLATIALALGHAVRTRVAAKRSSAA